MFFADLKVARLGVELVHNLGIWRSDDAMRPVYLEMLVDGHFLGEEIVLDEHDVHALLTSAVDDTSHRRKQLRSIQRIGQCGILFEEAFEQIDYDDGAAVVHGLVTPLLRTSA